MQDQSAQLPVIPQSPTTQPPPVQPVKPPPPPPPLPPITPPKSVDPPSAPEEKKPKKFIFVILTILVMVLGAVTAVFGYQYIQRQKQETKDQTQTQASSISAITSPSSSPEPTAGWETYTNEEHGYEFKCLDNFEQINTDEDGQEAPYYEVCSDDNNQVLIQVFEIEDISSFTPEGITKELEEMSTISTNFKEATISGKKAFSYQSKYNEEQEENVIEILLEEENKFIHIRGFNQNYFNQFFSTFKFIDQEQTDSQISCDAQSPCITGDCYLFPDEEKPICFQGDPCQECESKKCTIAESYPMQIFCQ